MASKIIGADYHRNGVSGVGFYVGIIEDEEDGRRKLVVTFPHPDNPEDEDMPGFREAYTAVLDLDEAALGNIYMYPQEGMPGSGGNAWRGDHYDHLRREFAAFKFPQVADSPEGLA